MCNCCRRNRYSMAHKHLLVVIVQMRDQTLCMRLYQMVSAERKDIPPGSPGAHIALHTGTELTEPIVQRSSTIGVVPTSHDGWCSCRAGGHS